jgi:CubicO group peptidase (beta-lactamase class C family)
LSPRRFLPLALPLLLLWGVAPAAPQDAPAQAPPAAPAGDDDAFAADTHDYLSRLQAWGFSGVVLVARGETPLLAQGYGLADRERGIPWTPGTVSDIGSITKQFTGAAILALVEDGKLRVTETLADHFENVPEDKRAITLHQLLTHSSGIVDLEGHGDWDPLLRDEFVRRILAQRLAFAPGSGWQYSNAGYSLLGAIVEQETGGSYERFVRERFFLPLGMYDTGYVLAKWGEGRLAQGYEGEERWGTTLERPLAEDGPFWVLRANGGIHTTAYDMLRWSRALLEGRILGDESRRQLWEPHVPEGPGAETHYGYGWSVQDLPGAGRVITHNGGNGIHFADLALVPGPNVVVFLQTNVAAGNAYVNRLLEQIGFRLVGGQPYPQVPVVVAADPARLAALAGEWRLESGGRLRAAAEGETLSVEPLDRDAFGALLSLPPADAAVRELGRRRTERLEAALPPLLAGDASGLHGLYGGAVELERLSEVWRDRLAGFAENVGALAGVEVIGTARRADRDYTLVRFRGERGVRDVVFVWEAPAEGRLLGVTFGGFVPRLGFRAEPGGGWVAFDPQSGGTLRMRAEGEGEAARLRIGDPPVAATRVPGAGD